MSVCECVCSVLLVNKIPANDEPIWTRFSWNGYLLHWLEPYQNWWPWVKGQGHNSRYKVTDVEVSAFSGFFLFFSFNPELDFTRYLRLFTLWRFQKDLSHVLYKSSRSKSHIFQDTLNFFPGFKYFRGQERIFCLLFLFFHRINEWRSSSRRHTSTSTMSTLMFVNFSDLLLFVAWLVPPEKIRWNGNSRL